MEQTPYWEPDSCVASHEIPLLLWIINVFKQSVTRPCRVSQMNSAHTLTPHIFQVLFNIIISCMPRFSKWRLSLRFSD
jgi:hypothetical protein